MVTSTTTEGTGLLAPTRLAFWAAALLLVGLAGCGHREGDTGTAVFESPPIPAAGATITYTDPDYPSVSIEMVFPAGAVPSGTRITVTKITSAPSTADMEVLPGYSYDFGPDGVFTAPMELTVTYDPADLGTLSEEDLRILERVDTGGWTVLNTTVDTTEHTVSAGVSGFSMFDLGIALDTTPPTTTATPPGGTFADCVDVELACMDDEGGIGCYVTYYTLDGSMPAPGIGTLYTRPLTLSEDTTLRFSSADIYWNREEPQTATYTVSGCSESPPVNTTDANFINGGDPFTSSLDLTLEISATDDTGVTGYHVGWEGVEPPLSDTRWVSIPSTKNYSATVSYTHPITGRDGQRTVYVWFRDADNLLSDVVSDFIFLQTNVVTYRVGGTGSGATGSFTLQLNDETPYRVPGDGPFTFPTPLPDLSSYSVAVVTHPTNQVCVLKNAIGGINGADVDNITVTCSDTGGGTKVAIYGEQGNQTKYADLLDANGIQTVAYSSGFNPSPRQVNGDAIVWSDTRNGNRDIFLYRISTGIETQITDDPSDQPGAPLLQASNVEIDGDFVVWMDGRNGDSDIYAYRISTGQEILVTNAPGDQIDPSVSDGVVTWLDFPSVSQTVVYLASLPSGAGRAISSTGYNWGPRVSSGHLVWSVQPATLGGSSEIYLYDLTTQQTLRVVPPGNAEVANLSTRLSGDFITWTGPSPSSIRYAYHVPSGTSFVLDDSTGDPVGTLTSKNYFYARTASNVFIHRWNDQTGLLESINWIDDNLFPSDGSFVDLIDGDTVTWTDNSWSTLHFSQITWPTLTEITTAPLPSFAAPLTQNGTDVVWLDGDREDLITETLADGTPVTRIPTPSDLEALISNVTDYKALVLLAGHSSSGSAAGHTVGDLVDLADAAGVNMLAGEEVVGLFAGDETRRFGLTYTWVGSQSGVPLQVEAAQAGAGHPIFGGLDTSSPVVLETQPLGGPDSAIDTDTNDPASPTDWTVLGQFGAALEPVAGTAAIVEFSTQSGTTVMLNRTGRLFDHPGFDWTSDQRTLLVNEVNYLLQ